MVDVGELVRFAPGEKTLRMAMDIAAAIERYRIAMEGPAGVRLRKLNHMVKSCIFHFVFETIHPFPDGNGRMGRLWQTVILGRWNPLFYALPIENMVLCHQRRYYHTLHSAQESGNVRVFVDFMLDMILRTLKTRGESQGGKKRW